MARILWHPAFVQAIQHELEDYREILTFESEHQLTTEPLRIDVLIIKKEKDVVIEKNIARIFRQFNIIEYKSPEERVTVEAYHKTQCYARLYAALNKADINDMSVTVVATHHPRALLTFLNKQYTVTHVPPAIYLVDGDTCPTQIIVSEKLPEKENLWLKSLRGDLTTEQLERLALSKDKDLPMDAYFYAIGAANIKAMEEFFMPRRKKSVILSEKLDAYFNEKYATPRAAQTGRDFVLGILRKKFKRVPRETERIIQAMNDLVALQSWAEQAAVCNTLDEFAEALK